MKRVGCFGITDRRVKTSDTLLCPRRTYFSVGSLRFPRAGLLSDRADLGQIPQKMADEDASNRNRYGNRYVFPFPTASS